MDNDHREMGGTGCKSLLSVPQQKPILKMVEMMGIYEMKTKTMGTTMTSELTRKLIMSCIVVLAQESFITADITEIMGHFSTKGQPEHRGNLNCGHKQPNAAGPHTSWAHTLLFMMIMYLKGLQMAT